MSDSEAWRCHSPTLEGGPEPALVVQVARSCLAEYAALETWPTLVGHPETDLVVQVTLSPCCALHPWDMTVLLTYPCGWSRTCPCCPGRTLSPCCARHPWATCRWPPLQPPCWDWGQAHHEPTPGTSTCGAASWPCPYSGLEWSAALFGNWNVEETWSLEQLIQIVRCKFSFGYSRVEHITDCMFFFWGTGGLT